MSDTRYIFGFHAVTAKIRHAPDAVKELFVSTARQDGRMRDLIRAAEAAGVKWVQMEPARLDGLAGGAARHQGVVARVLARNKMDEEFIVNVIAFDEAPCAALLALADGEAGGKIAAGSLNGSYFMDTNSGKCYLQDYIQIGEWKADDNGSLWIKIGSCDWKMNGKGYSFENTDLGFVSGIFEF